MNIEGVYRFFQKCFRPQRMRQFIEIFDVKSDDHVLDIGGSALIWSYISVKPKVTIGNIEEEDREEGRFSYRKLDGTNLLLDDASVGIVFSNSVIEHVGDWGKQMQFANEIRRVAKYYYVQTPNRWCFVEPHFVSPFIHFLPRPIYRKLLPFFSLWIWVTRPTSQKVNQWFEEIKLLNEAQMRDLFPDALLIKEKFLFFTKSLISVKAPQPIEVARARHSPRPPLYASSPSWTD